MITVRLPNGQVITYNRANLLKTENGWSTLYTKQDGDWIASIVDGSGIIVECEKPCKIETVKTKSWRREPK